MVTKGEIRYSEKKLLFFAFKKKTLRVGVITIQPENIYFSSGQGVYSIVNLRIVKDLSIFQPSSVKVHLLWNAFYYKLNYFLKQELVQASLPNPEMTLILSSLFRKSWQQSVSSVSSLKKTGTTLTPRRCTNMQTPGGTTMWPWTRTVRLEKAAGLKSTRSWLTSCPGRWRLKRSPRHTGICSSTGDQKSSQRRSSREGWKGIWEKFKVYGDPPFPPSRLFRFAFWSKARSPSPAVTEINSTCVFLDESVSSP